MGTKGKHERGSAQAASLNPRKTLESVPFHRVMRQFPTYRWWKPLLAMLVAAVLWFVFQVIIGIGEGAIRLYMAGMDGLLTTEILEDSNAIFNIAQGSTGDDSVYLGMDYQSPLTYISAGLSIGSGILAAALSCRWFKIGNFKTLSSNQGGLRWKSLGIYMLTALVGCLIVLVAVQIPHTGIGNLGEMTIVPAAIICCIIFIPIQAAGEEYLFRGLGMQAVGSWIPSIVIVLIIQMIVFMAVHGYNLVGNITVGISGLLFGILAYKTGGLEASIAMHAANNVVAFASASLFAGMAIATDATIIDSALDVLGSVFVFAILYLVAKKRGEIQDTKNMPR